ncbi:hypothetical protein NOR_07299 [Metarhizium rileyi]|uniref:Uncharacterized protein n=1 Tax=Metarhizium rileyi (strain RCEF 4871) TaxID=1649241 RepID=A0A166YL71_METRR|nr:hypothetical protein NOR_07299 [Metarhizium rileyi RCEF 4871]
MSASSNTLSHERLQEFYDKIIFPAIRKAIKDPFHQEIPQSFYMVYAMSPAPYVNCPVPSPPRILLDSSPW